MPSAFPIHYHTITAIPLLVLLVNPARRRRDGMKRVQVWNDRPDPSETWDLLGLCGLGQRSISSRHRVGFYRPPMHRTVPSFKEIYSRSSAEIIPSQTGIAGILCSDSFSPVSAETAQSKAPCSPNHASSCRRI